ncbi:MAG TPA: single-stranded-DNA-specific exonuclease RecJ [Verrucomicrobiota bacterium]|nr:single-stranded-DNA-specific exonuclease RecJ [Verrucomicrobiota bacterium]HNT15606.1 single-stranded-DNA-specific exonuclease RecJ [Verrucomicrobiota bacterium]
MKYRWLPAPSQPLLVGPLAAQLNLSPLLVQCLVNRGLDTPAAIRNFLQPRLRHLADPFLLPDMDKAVARLLQARALGESLVIFGDYDVDGVTSSTLLLQTLRELGWQVSAYLPRRLDEGYGLSREGVENCLHKYPAKVLLAVDCGSTAGATIAWLNERHVDVIVLDHHQISTPPPPALALVNPRAALSGEPPPPETAGMFTELCSVGLAFKLAHALVKRGREIKLPGADGFDVRSFLDLVALGTVADLVPLVGENRILVAAGFERLNTTRRPGLMALKQVAQSPASLDTFDIGFQLAPRLNASGRLETAEDSLHLLLAETMEEALPLAQRLDSQNRERQKIERAIVEEVSAQIRARFNPETEFVIVEGQLHWHIGVVGVVSARVLQEFYRPTFIIGGEGENWRGSGRSIAGFDLAMALRECDDLLVRHGGHAMAAGVTIQPDKVDAFRARLNAIARRTLKPEDLQPPLRLDAEVKLGALSLPLLAELEQMKPMGQENPPLQFYATRLSHQRPLRRVGPDRQHVKMWVTDDQVVHEAIWWNAGGGRLPTGKFDLAFAPRVNEYKDRRSLQLKVLDWRPATSGG